jgi:hypothetical protein
VDEFGLAVARARGRDHIRAMASRKPACVIIKLNDGPVCGDGI